jgi:hypothetical protein
MNGAMKMLNPQTLPNGGEQHEAFTAQRKRRVQYDYRHTDG